MYSSSSLVIVLYSRGEVQIVVPAGRNRLAYENDDWSGGSDVRRTREFMQDESGSAGRC